MIHDLSSAFAVALWTGGALILLPLYRAHHDRAIRYLGAVLILFAVSRLFALNEQRTSPTQLIILNLLVLASAYCEICFFRLALHNQQHRTPPPRFTREVSVALAVASVAIGAWLLAPEFMRGDLAQPKYGYAPAAFTFVAVLVGYYITVSARVVAWAGLFIASFGRGRASLARTADHGTRKGLVEAGLRAGLVIMGLAELLRLAADLQKLAQAAVVFFLPTSIPAVQALYPLVNLCIRTGHTAFYIGAIIPIAADAAAAIPALRRQARNYKACEPLWRAIVGAFPDIEFPARGVYARFYRRELEIRDGLVLLGPYYSRHIAMQAHQAAVGHQNEKYIILASLIREALLAYRQRRPANDPHPLPTSGAATREEDSDWLVRLGRAFAGD